MDIIIAGEAIMTNLNDAKEGMQTLEELWISLGKISSHVVEDNGKCDGEYPVTVRKLQMVSIRTLIDAIEAHHTD